MDILEEGNIIDKLDIPVAGCRIEGKIIKSVLFPTRDDLARTGSITLKKCKILDDLILECSEFSSRIILEDCIFKKDVTLFGYFKEAVSFEGSSFSDATVDFQECEFEHFVLAGAYFKNCKVIFQQTAFYSNNVLLSNITLNDSQLLFQNSTFNKNADLMDLLCLKADEGSKVLFQMVDFKFNEIRFYHSDIKWLEFRDCTFECNRFDFDCNCETLIMQDCKNFRILTLHGLKGLNNLNIYNFVNTGKVLFNQQLDFFIKAINCQVPIIWIKGLEYKAALGAEVKNQLFALMDFVDRSQSGYLKLLQGEIDMLDKREELKHGRKIFLSYSWNDEHLADSIEAMFINKDMPLTRDKHDLQYKGSIKEFMKQIRVVDFALIIISESYLKSQNCMFEIAEFTKDESYRDRILPVVRSDAHIFKVSGRNEYTKYWQKEYRRLLAELQDLDELNRGDTLKELIQVERIMRDLPEFLRNISDMKMIVCDDSLTDIDFAKMLTIIEI